MKEITAADVQHALLKRETMHIIDVRTTDEVASGKIPGAINIPLHLLDAKLPDLHKQTPYICVCHASGRSAQATQFLTQMGYDATNMVGGMLAWEGPLD